MSIRNLLQAGKTSYEGPTNHSAIIRQIHEDCRKEMSCDFIERVVGLFFSTIGIEQYMKKRENFKIPLMGSFMVTKAGRKKFAKQEAQRKERKRLAHNRKVNKYIKKQHAIKNHKRVNKNNANSGRDLIDFDTFMKIKGDTRPR